jgi:zinc protease
MGTGKDNFLAARDGIVGEIARLRTEPVTTEELTTAQNKLWGSSLTRRLSRVNQAYYMALNEYLGLGYDYDDRKEELIRAVTVEDVQRVAGSYFDTENYILTTVGDLE